MYYSIGDSFHYKNYFVSIIGYELVPSNYKTREEFINAKSKLDFIDLRINKVIEWNNI